ncbi:tripartite motif-containing protein 16-like [Stegastes partitus]|uniref:Tripartite motif-containing protein 16-like n=1 Tax=Stegastes partitus TaxID=144197 RepID=A0A9Y4N9I4_9TELE|nr:PREDICTED: tripartite motif-containing protein 16-like [Stegastes partitus]
MAVRRGGHEARQEPGGRPRRSSQALEEGAEPRHPGLHGPRLSADHRAGDAGRGAERSPLRRAAGRGRSHLRTNSSEMRVCWAHHHIPFGVGVACPADLAALLDLPQVPAVKICRLTRHPLSVSAQKKARVFAETVSGDVTAAVEELRDGLQDVLRDAWTNISLAITDVDVLLSEPKPEPEPKTRAGFLRCSREITLDPNTANRKLLLSDGNRKVTLTDQQQHHPDHPDRFIERYQVLSKESLTGRCYWEVEWRGGGVDVAVSYKNISRTGSTYECGFGYNDKSWSLYCSTNSCVFWHNKTQTLVSDRPPSRVGVYLDHRAGVLSFYRVSDTMTLLHRVQTSFTQPLHAGVWLPYGSGDTAELIKAE